MDSLGSLPMLVNATVTFWPGFTSKLVTSNFISSLPMILTSLGSASRLFEQPATTKAIASSATIVNFIVRQSWPEPAQYASFSTLAFLLSTFSAAPDFALANLTICVKFVARGFLILPDDNATNTTAEAATPGAGPASTATPPSERADLRPENIQDAVIRLAGNSQDGIQTAGAFLARLAGRSDHDVMTYMTIPSTISGGPSIFQV